MEVFDVNAFRLANIAANCWHFLALANTSFILLKGWWLPLMEEMILNQFFVNICPHFQ